MARVWFPDRHGRGARVCPDVPTENAEPRRDARPKWISARIRAAVRLSEVRPAGSAADRAGLLVGASAGAQQGGDLGAGRFGVVG
jgi:hypothetical protein